MQIHDLNTKALTNPAYVAFDDGTDTYKADFKAEIDNAAADAVADADLTDNSVAFTSGDAESPTEWTAVDVLTSGLPIKTLFNRISTMVKNVRYIWGLIGTTALGTTATTITGAIAEHEQDISGLNSKISYEDTTATTGTTTYDGRYFNNFDIPTNKGTLIGMFVFGVGDNKAAYAIRISETLGRVYTHAPSTSVTVRMLFMQ